MTAIKFNWFLTIAIYSPLLLVTTTSALSGMSSATTASLLSIGGPNLRNLVVTAAEQDAHETLDVTGILWTEHINLVVGSIELAAYFYVDFLGFTRDDSTSSFHINLGQQQFHLAETGAGDDAAPQRVAGSIGLIVPSLETVRTRLPLALKALKGTQFQVPIDDDENCMTMICPWGNTIHLYGVDNDRIESESSTTRSPRKMVNLHVDGGAHGAHRMAIRGKPGIRYLEIACPRNKSTAIAHFYRTMLGCTVTMQTTNNNNKAAVVCVGPGVHLVFAESDDDVLSQDDTTAMEGVHICFYANDFKGLYDRLAAKQLIWTNPRFVHLDSCDSWEDAAASRTLRFKNVIDLETGETILELEHETRPLRHGQYLKVPRYDPK